MIVGLTAAGVLEIRPETSLEQFALRKWADENVGVGVVSTTQMLIYTCIEESADEPS